MTTPQVILTGFALVALAIASLPYSNGIISPAFAEDNLATKDEMNDEQVCFTNINSKKETTQELLDKVGCKKGDKVVISTYWGKIGIPYLFAVSVTSGRICDFTQAIVSNNVSANTVTTCVYTGKVLPVVGSSKAMDMFRPK